MYYINDGVYASFNCLFYDHAEVSPILLGKDQTKDQTLFKSSIWGPTCDGLDLVIKECLLPELNTGDFMVYKNMGAYTCSGAVAFNGIPLARCIYVASTSWETIKDAFTEPADEPLVNNLLKEATSNSSTCAAAATLAFTRCLSSIQQQQQAELILADETIHLTTSFDGKSCMSVNDQLISDKIDLNDDCLDQTSVSVDCAITC